MKKTFLIIVFLLIPFAAKAQEKALQIQNLKQAVSEDIKTTRLEFAQKVFPDVTGAENLLTRSIPVRRLKAISKPLQINQKMRIARMNDFQFNDEGKLRLAILFHLQTPDSDKSNAYILAIYRFEPTFELVDAIDARLEDDSVEVAEGFTEIAVRKGKKPSGTVQLINRRKLSANREEQKHRFLLLEGGKLRVVAEFPAFINRKDCGGVITHEAYVNPVDRPKDAYTLFELSVEKKTSPNEDCPNQTMFDLIESEIYRVRWDAQKRVFRTALFERGAFVAAPWGAYLWDEYERYDSASVKAGRGYRAQAFYNPRTGDIWLAAPGKFPRGTQVKFEFEDYWGLSPSDKKKIVRGEIEFQIIAEETEFLPGNRRRTVFQCVLLGFGKKKRFSQDSQ